MFARTCWLGRGAGSLRPAYFELVKRVDVGAGGSDEGVRVGSLAGGDEALLGQADRDGGLRVRAFGDGVNLVEFEHRRVWN